MRQFDPAHPVYQPIPDDCPLDEHSDAIVGYIATQSGFHFDTGTNSPPVYLGGGSNSLWTIAFGGRAFSVRAPVGIKPGTGVDGPLVLLGPKYAGFCTTGYQPTEFRMWKAKVDAKRKRITCAGLGCGSYRMDGQTLDNEIVQPGRVPRALGQAEAYGQNTGSGCSYTVGMIRPEEVTAGRIDHAIRVAAGYVHGARFYWPALRTEPSFPTADRNCPMGARVFLDASVDVVAVGDAAAGKLADPRQKGFARTFVKALQEFGMIPLDGTEVGSNVYFEGATADWSTVLGPVNSYGTYNDIARAVATVLPWNRLRVAHQDVFDSFARA